MMRAGFDLMFQEVFGSLSCEMEYGLSHMRQWQVIRPKNEGAFWLQ
jgi:hypothetical protein